MARKKDHKARLRRCIALKSSFPQSMLLRLVEHDGKIMVDESRCISGRGMYILPTPEALEQAIKTRAFSRTLRKNIDDAILKEAYEDIKTYIREHEDDKG